MVDTNPEVAETLVHNAEARRERLIRGASLEAVMNRARPSMSRCFEAGIVGHSAVWALIVGTASGYSDR